MNYSTTSGAVIAIGPEAATKDAAGYEAVTVLDIGGVTNIGAFGKVWNTATLTPLADEQVIELKTSFNLQHPELTLAIDVDSEGQAAAEAANDTHLFYTIKVTKQNGDAFFVTAQVSGFSVDFSADSFENGTISLLAQTARIKVPAA